MRTSAIRYSFAFAALFITNNFAMSQIVHAISGVEINARPLARGEWKSQGMSRIFAQVVCRASGYLNLFCQLYVPTNESNY